jgi:hypothetical protein
LRRDSRDGNLQKELADSADEEAIGLGGRHASGLGLRPSSGPQQRPRSTSPRPPKALVTELGRERLDGLDALAGIAHPVRTARFLITCTIRSKSTSVRFGGARSVGNADPGGTAMPRSSRKGTDLVDDAGALAARARDVALASPVDRLFWWRRTSWLVAGQLCGRDGANAKRWRAGP